MIELATITTVATSLFAFLSLMATLVFLWKVYNRGGPDHLKAAARALRDSRPHRLPGISSGLRCPRRRRSPAEWHDRDLSNDGDKY
ncbi:hypothetical protein [Amycolatopsis panacis]|uniref:Uncharacterized protein n=1 Tax=Amycolatopsis panacis TaxID=2340917 RepID=A0A419I735_9PSEU|nr:hypothetical protein [Amycolatopsis panacis]RJQ87483.1 hypothetical protein D5S19_09625 [Amycolatopsis panacis]